MADIKQVHASHPQQTTAVGLATPPAQWVVDAYTNFKAGQYDAAADILQKKYKALTPPNGTANTAGTKTKPFTETESPHEVFDASFYHNYVLSSYLYDGRVVSVPSKVLDKPSEESGPSKSRKASTASSVDAKKRSTSALDASNYALQSIESTLASIGHVSPLAWCVCCETAKTWLTFLRAGTTLQCYNL